MDVKRLGLIASLVGCGFHSSAGQAPSDGSVPPVLDAPDASIDAPDAMVLPDAQSCFGTGLLKGVCLVPLPSAPVTLPRGNAVINTDATGGANCDRLVTQTGGGPQLCVIAGTTITVTGSIAATGGHPLVLVGTQTVTIAAGSTLDVSSTATPRRVGAGSNQGCTGAGINGADDTGGGGGGAGGSFGTIGGKGGVGDTNNNGNPNGSAPGGTPVAAQPTPTVLRGGCSGGRGGAPDNMHAGGTAGDGGGAVYLIAGSKITVAGNVFASGAGGGASTGNGGAEQGAGGGGAGGMIGFDAPMIQVDGLVVANGGAGAGGGGVSGGEDGGDGTTTMWDKRAVSGKGNQNPSGNGGDGADGTAINMVGQLDGANSVGGGGGGAGGLGLIWTYGILTGGATTSPALTQR